MKFTIETRVLQEALSTVNHATASISTTPILENILIKVNYNNIVLTANNLEMAIEKVINEWISIDVEWAFCVPSRIFTNYVWLITDDKIDIELLKDNSIEIKTNSSDIKIKWNDAWDFPLIPTVKESISFNINSNILTKSIEKTLFSSAEWNIRPTLAWIYVSVEWPKAKFASTDSFRLSEYKVDLEENLSQEFAQIIPSKTASQIRSILESNTNVKIVAWENQIVFLFENIKVYSRLLNWKFPEYEWFFPNLFNTKAVINRVDLIQALKKINLISKENNYSIKMSFSLDGNILLETSETQIWEWKIFVTWSVEWEETIIWLNSVYFLEALGVIESTHIWVSFESPLSPIMITPIDDEWSKKTDNFKHIIMPLKI